MIAVDTNILIYANRAELALHATARTRLTELAEGPVPWGVAEYSAKARYEVGSCPTPS